MYLLWFTLAYGILSKCGLVGTINLLYYKFGNSMSLEKYVRIYILKGILTTSILTLGKLYVKSCNDLRKYDSDDLECFHQEIKRRTSTLRSIAAALRALSIIGQYLQI